MTRRGIFETFEHWGRPNARTLRAEPAVLSGQQANTCTLNIYDVGIELTRKRLGKIIHMI